MTQSNSKTESDPAPVEHKTVGKLLQAARRDAKLDLKEVELATKIRGKYLRLLEADDTAELANDVYVRGFLRSYANYLGLDGAAVVRKFESQRGAVTAAPLVRKPQQMERRKLVYTPRLLIGSIVGLLAAAIIAYLGSQFQTLAAPPKLQVSSPSKDQEVYGSLQKIIGHVEGGADVFVNDSPILSDSNGNFTDSIALQNGVNAITVTAKSKLGKTTQVVRNILAHVPKPDPTTALPTAPFDGVAVNVTVSNSATGVIIKADGKEVFHGIMLPGTTQTFRATSTLIIGTADAGATSVTVTNSLVASKIIGALGKRGAARDDVEFAKDTNFQ